MRADTTVVCVWPRCGWLQNTCRPLHPTSSSSDSDTLPAETAPQGIFGVPLIASIPYANVAISLFNEHGESYIYGYVPIVVAKCGVFLKEKGKHGCAHTSATANDLKQLTSRESSGWLAQRKESKNSRLHSILHHDMARVWTGQATLCTMQPTFCVGTSTICQSPLFLWATTTAFGSPYATIKQRPSAKSRVRHPRLEASTPTPLCVNTSIRSKVCPH